MQEANCLRAAAQRQSPNHSTVLIDRLGDGQEETTEARLSPNVPRHFVQALSAWQYSVKFQSCRKGEVTNLLVRPTVKNSD